MEGVRQQKQPKLRMIFLADTGSDPRTMVVVFPHTSATVKAMFGPILGSTVANLAKVALIPRKLQQLILLNCTSLKPWILPSSEHEVRIDDKESDEGKEIDAVVI